MTSKVHYGEAVKVRELPLALLPLSLCTSLGVTTGCIRTLDLRGPEGSNPTDHPCPPQSRVDPQTGLCAPCIDTDPHEVCPCGFEAEPAPFPACEGPYGTFTCHEACEGDVTVCAAYEEVDGFVAVSDCTQLYDCCERLAASSGSTPCCEPNESLVCLLGSGVPPFPYTFRCLSTACCEKDCSSPDDCDTTFQTCQDNRCVPGCDTTRELCLHDGDQCECRPISP